MSSPSSSNVGFDYDSLIAGINNAAKIAKDQLDVVKGGGTTDSSGKKEVNIGDMFDLQWKMNQLAQVAEGSSQAVSACHGAISSMSRNIK